MRCSTIIGSLEVNKESVYKTVKGERFFDAVVVLDGSRFPAVISEFLAKQNGKHEIMCYLRSESRDKKMFTFLQIEAINKVDEEEKDANVAHVYGDVSKVFPMKTTLRGTTSVKMIGVRYFSSDKNVNVAHCIGFKDIARRLNTIDVGDNVLLVGSFSMKSSIEVVVKEITTHNPKRVPVTK